MKKNCIKAFVLLLPISLAGCMSGLGGSSHFDCKAPEGVSCESVSGIYANSIANNLPSQKVSRDKNVLLTDKQRKNLPDKKDDSINGIIGQVANSGDPIRSAPVVNRVWLAPWVDKDGDLHDQEYIYMLTDPGHWELAHNDAQIASRFTPTFLRTPSKANNKKISAEESAKKTASDLSSIYDNSTKIIKLPDQGQ